MEESSRWISLGSWNVTSVTIESGHVNEGLVQWTVVVKCVNVENSR